MTQPAFEDVTHTLCCTHMKYARPLSWSVPIRFVPMYMHALSFSCSANHCHWFAPSIAEILPVRVTMGRAEECMSTSSPVSVCSNHGIASEPMSRFLILYYVHLDAALEKSHVSTVFHCASALTHLGIEKQVHASSCVEFCISSHRPSRMDDT